MSPDALVVESNYAAAVSGTRLLFVSDVGKGSAMGRRISPSRASCLGGE